MECWWKRAVVLSIRRVRLGVATRLGIRRTGLRKLRKEVRTCEYNDVHVMWELLRKTDPEIGRRTPALCGGMQRRRWTSLFHWAPCNLCRNF
ncbi:hypothetical protein Cni_G08350 [Canna indica]|uniref:Uncharacterized protein n=1 Tax=Canna indica TaxID=4628 RepID=A0AAQ3Q6P5_9LILI|nr:hypothetical protein Cni_G08350 [Canna indica]